MDENQLSMVTRSRLLFEVSKHLQAAADLFDYLKHIDEKMCLKTITTGSGKVIVHLEYEVTHATIYAILNKRIWKHLWR